jgi:hypothetical protein
VVLVVSSLGSVLPCFLLRQAITLSILIKRFFFGFSLRSDTGELLSETILSELLLEFCSPFSDLSEDAAISVFSDEAALVIS